MTGWRCVCFIEFCTSTIHFRSIISRTLFRKKRTKNKSAFTSIFWPDLLATLIVHAGSSRWYLFPRTTAQRAHFVACSEELLRCGLRSHRGGSSSIAFTLSSPPGSCVSFLLILTPQHPRNNTRVFSFSRGQLSSLAFDTVPSSRLRSTTTPLAPAQLPSAPPLFALLPNLHVDRGER
jgi:hypothetical protein